ncbi:hypothetical protein CsSME_00023312 [Camellia sinensis var. sinensis]
MVTTQILLSLLTVTLMSSSIFLLLPTTHLDLSNANSLKNCGFDRIYQFGDSISDTGNFIRESEAGAASSFAKLPYGQTFFNKATGRCSNGRLMIDYFETEGGRKGERRKREERRKKEEGRRRGDHHRHWSPPSSMCIHR